MASKIFFPHQKVYFWISAFDHRAIVLDKMHIVHWGTERSYMLWVTQQRQARWKGKVTNNDGKLWTGR